MSNKILCMYSGGLDSTGALWELTTDKKYAEFDILVHHINIMDSINPAKNEDLALSQIVATFEEITGRKLPYSSTLVDFSYLAVGVALPAIPNIYAFVAGNLVQIDLTIKYIAVGSDKILRAKDNASYDVELNQSQQLLKIIGSQREVSSSAEYVYPVELKSSRNIWQTLPEKIRESILDTGKYSL